MDHLEPLKGWLNDLTGDAGEVQAFSQTWTNIAQQLAQAGADLQRYVADVETQAGETMEAYRRFQQDAGKHIDMAGQISGAFATGLGIASTIVQVVHDLVRDAIAQIVGSAISWAAEAVFSLGLATPWIIEQVSTRVASLVEKVGGKLTDLLSAVKKLKALLDKAKDLLDALKKLLDKALHATKEGVAALPGVRRLDPRRTKLIDDMEAWSAARARPDYKPFGDLSPTEYIDKHLKQFTEGGFPDWRWPKDDGFDVTKPIVPADDIVKPGDVIDRLAPVHPSKDTGEFTTVPGSRFEGLGLPADRNAPAFQNHQLEVVKPLPPEVRAGSIAPAFEQPGGELQFHFPGGIKKWIDEGYIKVV